MTGESAHRDVCAMCGRPAHPLPEKPHWGYAAPCWKEMVVGQWVSRHMERVCTPDEFRIIYMSAKHPWVAKDTPVWERVCREMEAGLT